MRRIRSVCVPMCLLKMIEMPRHRLTFNNNCIICQYICCMLLIGMFHHGSFEVMSDKFNINRSATLSTDINSAMISSQSSRSPSMASPTMSPAELSSSPSSASWPTTPPTNSDFVTSNEADGPTPIHGWQCHCWNTTNLSEVELECRCKGSALVRIPQRLHTGMQRLTVSNAGLNRLRYTGLKMYASSLQDIMLVDLLEFESIEPGAFYSLIRLRTLYISHAPKLTHLSAKVFEGISSTFRSLRILYSGLIKIPDLRFISSTGNILYMVDLEGNQIVGIDEKSVNIKTEQLILDNNALTYIQQSAFFGSSVAKLSFKSNQKLKKIHSKAFAGIINIMELDLSNTSIETVPTDGLQSLEILRIQNTHSLKMIPSVYNFQNLRIAWLTHSFHCCAFKFPQRHDPIRHAQRTKYLAELHKKCINDGYTTTDDANGSPGGNDDDVEIDASFNTSSIVENPDIFNSSLLDVKNDTDTQNLFRRFRRNLHGRAEFKNHFESANVDNQKFSDNMNKTQYAEFTDNDFINPITGAPIINQDAIDTKFLDANIFIPSLLDDGEFLDTPADVSPNNLKHATCGKLSVKRIEVMCYPVPDALNPCEDVMGSQWLRTSVWIVVSLAVFGNIAVLIVLFSNWKDVTVPKFLMSHLAFADLCLGLYLLLIAAIDIHSMDEYFNFAYDWQYGTGCRVAGFLTVFATHLSVFTLTIITVERWYAITHAINLNKRIKIRAASIIMACGWIYSIIMSSLPLFGISNYSSTSICLPMETRDSLDVIYLVSIMAVNGFAFFIIAICYAKIYLSLGKETRQVARNASRGEMSVAKKMALLVFTNFACWAPIAFFGLTALAGFPLIDVAKSKILLVFFYPLNSCADPYLYAILTSQYRRDLFILLSKYGFCTQRAQKYKMNYSFPTTNHSCPVPLLGRRSSPSVTSSTKRKSKDEQKQDEEFV